MLRLLMEDPSEDVCWTVAKLLGYRRDSKSLEQIRRLNPPETRPTAMLLCGSAWFGQDQAKGLSLLERAVESECKCPTFDTGELDQTFQTLAQNAVAFHHNDRAAHFRRLQANRAAKSDNSASMAVCWLFALHAKYGPLAGFDDDLHHFSGYLGDPCVMYALSRIAGMRGDSMESLALEQAARASSLTASSRIAVSGFLFSADWADLARGEASAALASNDPATAVYRLEARLQLAHSAGVENDDVIAVAHLNAAMDLIRQIPNDGARVARYGRIVEINDIAVEIAWRSARLFLNMPDAESAKKHLDKLMELSPTDSEAVQNAYPLLKSAGRNEDAKKLFENWYGESHRQLAQDADDPEMMNQIAWLWRGAIRSCPKHLTWRPAPLPPSRRTRLFWTRWRK